MAFLKKSRSNKNDNLFLFTALIIPALQFCIFYIIVNTNSILLAFKNYNGDGTFDFVGFNNIISVIKSFFNDVNMITVLKNTFTMYFASQILMLVIVTLFSFMIWKKVYAFKFFSVLLFLPSIISVIVFVMIGRYAVMYILPEIFNNPSLSELLNPLTTGFKTTLIYFCFLSMGSMVVLLSGAMSGVDKSLVEYGEIDGMKSFHQFRYLVLPHIFPTIISLFMIGMAGMFQNQGLILAFYQDTADYAVRTMGYHIYVTIYRDNNFYMYPTVSAMGIILTLVTITLSFSIKRILEITGPSEE